MSLLDIISQYTKLAVQSSDTGAGGLLGMAKGLLGNNVSSSLIQQFLTNLSPDIIQKLSALKTLGGETSNKANSSESFMSLFTQLANQFSNKQTSDQVADLTKPESADMVSKALSAAKNFGIDLDKFI